MRTLGIVTPYYQRSSGILRRTAESVAAQISEKGSLEMIWAITDDGSPISAKADLSGFQAPPWLQLQVERTANRGISAARNRSLDALRGNCDYIAFLDSDDVWGTSHSERAVTALDQGYDFYFSNYRKVGRNLDTFELFGFNPEHFLQGADGFFFPSSSDVFNAVIKRNPVWTTTVVTRESLVEEIRFEPKLRRAGEDHVFWMECCQNTGRIVSSRRCEAFAGEGLNVYAGAKQWGAPGTSRRAAAGLRYIDFVLNRYSLTPDQRIYLERRASHLRSEIATNVLHGIRRGRWSELFVLTSALISDKSLANAIVTRILK
jgi:succinoglycan biosynthesis protein ExoW